MSDLPIPSPAEDPSQHTEVLHGELLGDEDWDPRRAMNDLKNDRDVTDNTPEGQTQQIIIDAGPLAARSLVHIAAYGEKDSDRIRAASEVLKLGQGFGGDETNPLNKLAAMVVKELEQSAADAASDPLGSFFSQNEGKGPL